MVRKAGANNLLDYIDVRGMAEKLADELLEMGGTIVMLKCGHEGMYLRTAEKERWGIWEKPLRTA